VNDPERYRDLAQTLTAMGLQVDHVVDLIDIQQLLRQNRPDIAIIDAGNPDSNATAQLSELRRVAGSGLHIIVLIPADAEDRVAQLLHAGAADYLLYNFTESALIARLSNAQRLLSLQEAVRSERELAVSSSGEWARANRRLLHEALTDPLTQLPNRRYGLDRFAQEWDIAVSNNLPIACLMLDIDHFKRVNDERGHDVGDIVLHQIGRVIEGCCRRSDIIFRYGGEEFCGFCPSTALAEALQLAERIATAVRDDSYGRPEDLFHITLSIGVAVRTPTMTQSSELIELADKTLYAAKADGRNRVLSLQQ
jgi:diguanylate cyclase (GGDEF)-like protein